MFQTEFPFTLPCGYIDANGNLHREGVMRRATAADEILPLRDPRVIKNDAYLMVILLSRVITKLGGLSGISTVTIENLYVTDLTYLQNLYNDINRLDEGNHRVVCPECRTEFQPEGDGLGG
jgi:hypothetical protein